MSSTANNEKREREEERDVLFPHTPISLEKEVEVEKHLITLLEDIKDSLRERNKIEESLFLILEENLKEEKEILEKKKKRQEKKQFTPPTLEQIEEFIANKGYVYTDANELYEYYTEVDWRMRDGKKITSWKAAVSGWEKRCKERNANKPSKKNNDSFFDELSNLKMTNEPFTGNIWESK